MRVLIIEDEKLAADRLEKLIERLEPKAQVLGKLASVQASCRWLAANAAPDLAFLDIQLGDGLSFEIFEQCELRCPVIFTTAYDAYALRAFKLNSIDYLLKPLEEEALAAALHKYQRWGAPPEPVVYERTRLQLTQQYKQRFLIRLGEQLHTIAVEDVLYFWNEEKSTFLTTTAGKRFLVDYSLNQLEELLDPVLFFRINRQVMLRIAPIKNIIAYSGSRLKVVLQYAEGKEALVSRERVNEFKAWLDA